MGCKGSKPVSIEHAISRRSQLPQHMSQHNTDTSDQAPAEVIVEENQNDAENPDEPNLEAKTSNEAPAEAAEGGEAAEAEAPQEEAPQEEPPQEEPPQEEVVEEEIIEQMEEEEEEVKPVKPAKQEKPAKQGKQGKKARCDDDGEEAGKRNANGMQNGDYALGVFQVDDQWCAGLSVPECAFIQNIMITHFKWRPQEWDKDTFSKTCKSYKMPNTAKLAYEVFQNLHLVDNRLIAALEKNANVKFYFSDLQERDDVHKNNRLIGIVGVSPDQVECALNLFLSQLPAYLKPYIKLSGDMRGQIHAVSLLEEAESQNLVRDQLKTDKSSILTQLHQKKIDAMRSNLCYPLPMRRKVYVQLR